MSVEDEKQIDQQAALQIEQQIGIIPNQELSDYVEELGQKLAAFSPRQDVAYSFHVVEMDAPNAFALPGGHIYVSRGLITICNSEAQLANVLGHEIGHVAARHAAKRDMQQKTVGLVALLGGIAAVAAGGAGGEAIMASQLAGAGLIAAYGRDQERHADQIGQELAVRSKINPHGMGEFLRILEGTTRLRQGFSRGPGFLDTHPVTRERIVATTTSGEVLRWDSQAQTQTGRGEHDPFAPPPWEQGLRVADSRSNYLQRISGVAVGRPASEGVFEGDRFRHADLDFSLRFPHGWRLVNQRSRVLALAPGFDGLATLELQGSGDDPREAAEAFAEKEDLTFAQANTLRIGDLPAFRARTRLRLPEGPVVAELTWITHDGNIYRLMGGAPSEKFRRYEGVFRSFARSFRPLLEEERSQIYDLRLRIAVAQEGEDLAALTRRTENEWDLNWTAVVNDLFVEQPLSEGQLVKIAVKELYRPAPTVEEPPVYGPSLPGRVP